MFRIEAFVDDKNLAKVLYGLNGLVMNLSVLPVVNAEAKKGSVVAKTDGTLFELLLDHIKKTKTTELRAADIRSFLVSAGRNANSYGYLLKQGITSGLLKKSGKGHSTKYVVKG